MWGEVGIGEVGAPQLLPTLHLLRMDYNKTRGSLSYTVDVMIFWSHHMKTYCMDSVEAETLARRLHEYGVSGLVQHKPIPIDNITFICKVELLSQKGSPKVSRNMFSLLDNTYYLAGNSNICC